jgi:hypothetical protein
MRAAGSVEIAVDGIGTGYVRLIGDVSIMRVPPNPFTPDMVPIEIVSLSLTGFSPLFGRVVLAPSIASPSAGFTQRMVGVESPSDSFFDVFFDIFLPDLGMTLKSGGPFRIQARTTAVPFFDVHRVFPGVPLVDDDGNADGRPDPRGARPEPAGGQHAHGCPAGLDDRGRWRQ